MNYKWNKEMLHQRCKPCSFEVCIQYVTLKSSNGQTWLFFKWGSQRDKTSLNMTAFPLSCLHVSVNGIHGTKSSAMAP